MKKRWLLLGIFIGTINCAHAESADLMQVFRDALISDPVYQQAISQSLSDKENYYISLSNLLPSLSAAVAPNRTITNASGSATTGGNTTVEGYNATLTLTQTLFNVAQFANLSSNQALSKQADANVNAALQDLMIRVSKAYFKILEDEENLIAIDSSKQAFKKQLDQVQEQYKVGLKTITDVYTAEASYQKSVADYIAADTQLANDHENLRAITGRNYSDLANLTENFPLVTPCPSNIDAWVDKSQAQNWSIKSAQYAASSARYTIQQQFAGHLPNLNIQGQYEVDSTFTFGDTTIISLPGSSKLVSRSVTMNLAIPLVQGGQVLAQTRQAQDNYQVAVQKLEKSVRDTINLTRQSYLNVISSISKMAADRKNIQSSISSYEGMETGYMVGTQTLVNLLDQQQKVFNAKQQYASDRYVYVNSLLALKQATGTLSPNDLRAINNWLGNNAIDTRARIGTPRYIKLNPHLPCGIDKTRPRRTISSVLYKDTKPVQPVEKKPASKPMPMVENKIMPAEKQPVVVKKFYASEKPSVAAKKLSTKEKHPVVDKKLTSAEKHPIFAKKFSAAEKHPVVTKKLSATEKHDVKTKTIIQSKTTAQAKTTTHPQSNYMGHQTNQSRVIFYSLDSEPKKNITKQLAKKSEHKPIHDALQKPLIHAQAETNRHSHASGNLHG
jgi:outer membrane protein